MTATLTLNDMTIEQASAVLTLAAELEKENKAITPEEAHEGVEIFAPLSVAEDLTEETEEEPEYAIEQVRAAFTKYAKQNGKEAAKKLLEKFGAGKVTELKKTDYTAVMREVS
jgi:glutamate synthase domain-containing protein 3